jgi:hypothetical protein
VTASPRSPGLVPRWLVVFGIATGLVLLLTAGAVPWIEIIFPLWVLVLSVHILIGTIGDPAASWRQ